MAKAGTYRALALASNAHGQAAREFRIVVGKQLADAPDGLEQLVHPLQPRKRQDLREAADQMIASGMADYGYQYVNCDDCWAVHVKSTRPQISGPPRDAQGQLLPNKLPRHAGPDRLYPREGAQGGHLHFAGPGHVRRL